jgi:Ni,Fe-hydrogenase III small subunit/ferredoxin-like protein FixX
MNLWVINGLRAGIKTTVYPRDAERSAGVTPGLPCGCDSLSPSEAEALVDCCPTRVFSYTNGKISADHRRCIHCFRCVRGIDHSAGWRQTYEWAAVRDSHNEFIPAFKRSIHIIVVDAGDCGACLNEVKQLNNPYYNMHRLGFFITPSPRHADVMLVVGTVTDHMRVALKKVYDAMPAPKRVVAVGACALTGGIFADSFVCAKGLADVLPVDVEVPGNPPPPLAILHGLLVAAGRKSPASLMAAPSAIETNAAKF